jgi:hypothetical protein
MPPNHRPLKRTEFHVWIAPELGAEPEYVGEIPILNQDQLRAELEGPRHGLTNLREQPFHLTNLWIWAACVRLKLTELRFQDFKMVMEYDKEDDQPGADAADEPDPTSGARDHSTDSASPSLSTGATPLSG